MQTLAIDRQSIINAIERIPSFQGLSRDDLSKIAGSTIARSFEAGEMLGDVGDTVDEFWIVLAGAIDTFFSDEHGRMNRLASLGPDDHLGEMALIEATPRQIRVTAQSSGKLLAIPHDRFIDFVEAFPVLMRNLYRTLSLRFKKAVGVGTREIPSRRLGVVAPSRNSRNLVAHLVGRLALGGEKIRVIAEDAIGLSKHVAWPEHIPPTELSSTPGFGEDLPVNFDRRISILSRQSIDNVDVRLLHDCDEVLWLLEPKEGARVARFLQREIDGNANLKGKLRFVWLLSDEQPVAPWLPEIDIKKNAIKVHVSDDGLPLGRLQKQGLDRLVRALRGFKLGIALAGGGAKGMAHLGVLRALEDAGFNFDVMSGTSAGAMAGIIYASGIEPTLAAQQFQHDLTPSRIFRSLPGWPNLYLLYQFRRRAWDAMLRVYLHDWRLEQLPIDFLSLTVDLIQSRSVVRNTGDAVHAILESINLPVVSKPILRDGMMLVDGGMLDNLPADVLTNNHCDFIVGVDVSRRMKLEFAGNRPDTPTKHMKNANSLATLMRIFESQAHNLGAVRSRSIDFWITPNTSPFGLADFYRSQEISEVGEQAAREMLPELQQRLSELEQRLFNPAFSR